MATVITVSGKDLSKTASSYIDKTAKGETITVWKQHGVRWKCPDGALQIDFTGASPFSSNRKHLPKVEKNELTEEEFTKDIPKSEGKKSFHYTAKVFLPTGAVVEADPNLDVDPGPGPPPRPSKRKKKPPKQPKGRKKRLPK